MGERLVDRCQPWCGFVSATCKVLGPGELLTKPHPVCRGLFPWKCGQGFSYVKLEVRRCGSALLP